MVVLSCTGKDQTSVQLIWSEVCIRIPISPWPGQRTDCIYAGQNQSRLKREWLTEEEKVVKECWVYFRVPTQPE